MSEWDVYLVTQADRSAGRETLEIVEAAIEGGVDVVQLREKERSARERYTLGRKIRACTREAGVPLLVNDRVDLAMAVDADGVHLGDDDIPIAAARDLLGPDAIVGRSVSFVKAAERAVEAGADYVSVGAVYPTDSKQDIADEEFAVGPDRVSAVADAVDVPVVGIGGITAERAGSVIEAGADGVCVITEITAADDPAEATRELGDAVAAGQSRA